MYRFDVTKCPVAESYRTAKRALRRRSASPQAKSWHLAPRLAKGRGRGPFEPAAARPDRSGARGVTGVITPRARSNSRACSHRTGSCSEEFRNTARNRPITPSRRGSTRTAYSTSTTCWPRPHSRRRSAPRASAWVRRGVRGERRRPVRPRGRHGQGRAGIGLEACVTLGMLAMTRRPTRLAEAGLDCLQPQSRSIPRWNTIARSSRRATFQDRLDTLLAVRGPAITRCVRRHHRHGREPDPGELLRDARQSHPATGKRPDQRARSDARHAAREDGARRPARSSFV